MTGAVTPPQEMQESMASVTSVGAVPRNPMDMPSVESQFGAPGDRADPVGQPPITRWYYRGYTVYFEFDKVITSVIE